MRKKKMASPTKSQQSKLRKLPTTSAKIRYLDSQRFGKAEISRILSKRYQHVWNVLNTSRRRDLMPSIKLPINKQPSIKVVAMPKDTNAGGSIFGVWILSQVDIAAAIIALARAKGRVATVAINSVEFHEPVFVGDIVSYYADIIRTSRSSITVKVIRLCQAAAGEEANY